MSDSHESIHKWESSLDSSLVERLSKPLVKPGVINGYLSKSVFLRNGLIVNKHPLLNRLMKKSLHNERTTLKKVPIVYKATDNGIGSSINTENTSSVNTEQNPGQKFVNVSGNKKSSLINRKISDTGQTNELKSIHSNEVQKKNTFDMNKIENKPEKSLDKSADPGVIKSSLSESVFIRAKNSALNSPFISSVLQRQIFKQAQIPTSTPIQVPHAKRPSERMYRNSENILHKTTITPQISNDRNLQLKPLINTKIENTKTQNLPVYKKEITEFTDNKGEYFNTLKYSGRSGEKDSKYKKINIQSKKPDSVKTDIQKKEKLSSYGNTPIINNSNNEKIKIVQPSAPDFGEMNIKAIDKGLIKEPGLLPVHAYSFSSRQNLQRKSIIQKDLQSDDNGSPSNAGKVVVQNALINMPVVNRTEQSFIWRKSAEGVNNSSPLKEKNLNYTNIQHKYGLAGNTALISRQTGPEVIMPLRNVHANSHPDSDNFNSQPQIGRRSGIDINRIAERVSKILYKKLLIERERRGYGRWD